MRSRIIVVCAAATMALSVACSNHAEKTEKKTAANSGPSKEYVFIYHAGTVKQTLVTTGIQDDTYIQILSGLKEGDEVVSAPYPAISKTLKRVKAGGNLNRGAGKL